jgi:protein phosphatase-4 regulatory subunit 3
VRLFLAQPSKKLASVTIVEHDTELTLQQHLNLAPDLLANLQVATEGDSGPLMMAQQVPHQSTDKKRVKVYELRNNDWFDRGTGYCTAAFMQVSPKHPIAILPSLYYITPLSTLEWSRALGCTSGLLLT